MVVGWDQTAPLQGVFDSTTSEGGTPGGGGRYLTAASERGLFESAAT